MLTAMQMTIQQAATHLGVSQDTVRRRIRSGQLPATQTPRPQGFTWTVDLEGPAATSSNDQDHIDNGIVELLKEQLRVKDQQIDRLTQLLGAKALSEGHSKPWWMFWR